MDSTNTKWTIGPLGWFVLSLAIAAETVSNGLRAYGLGSHLDRFTVDVKDISVSLAGAVFVMAAIAVSLSQARAAWVALTPGRPARQRVVAGLAAILLLVVSVTAMASHILEAQRAKDGDEIGSAGEYGRTEAAYKKANAELDRLAKARTSTEIRADMDRVRIKPSIWAATNQCTDAELLKGNINGTACKPILDLRAEMGSAIRKAELEPEVSRLAQALAGMKPPMAKATLTEQSLGGYWGWIMGLAVVLLATFGSVIFATATTVTNPAPAPTRQPLPEIEVANDPLPLSTSDSPAYTRDEALADLATLVRSGQHPESQDWLAERWGRTKGCTSKWLMHWEATGQMPGNRQPEGRRKMVVGR